MARAHAEGKLVEVCGFEELPDRRVRVTAVLRELEPPRVRRRRQVWLVACGALVAVGVLMVLAWLARISTQLVRGKGLGEFVVEGAVAPPGDGGVGEVGLA